MISLFKIGEPITLGIYLALRCSWESVRLADGGITVRLRKPGEPDLVEVVPAAIVELGAGITACHHVTFEPSDVAAPGLYEFRAHAAGADELRTFFEVRP